MGRHYTQLTLEDRCQMAYLHTTGHSIRQIAATLDRAPSTVARELNRNGSTTQGYQPSYADQQARARRWQGSKLDRDSTLRATVLAQLQHGWSPQQVAGRLAREQPRPVISHETIYRFIYAQMARKTEKKKKKKRPPPPSIWDWWKDTSRSLTIYRPRSRRLVDRTKFSLLFPAAGRA